MTESLQITQHKSYPKLEELKSLCKEYLEGDGYSAKNNHMFQICNGTKNNEQYCLIVFQKYENTKENEKRRDVANILCARFRANILKVVQIINLNDLTDKVDHVICETFFVSGEPIEIIYIKGEPVEVKYDEMIDNVYTEGIRYTRSLDVVYYNYISMINDYNGYYVVYFPDGSKEGEGMMSAHMYEGNWIWYNSLDQTADIGLMVNDKREGVWKTYSYDTKTYKIDRFIILEEIEYMNGNIKQIL